MYSPPSRGLARPADFWPREINGPGNKRSKRARGEVVGEGRRGLRLAGTDVQQTVESRLLKGEVGD